MPPRDVQREVLASQAGVPHHAVAKMMALMDKTISSRRPLPGHRLLSSHEFPK